MQAMITYYDLKSCLRNGLRRCIKIFMKLLLLIEVRVGNAMDCLEFSFRSFYVFHYLYEILERHLPLPLDVDVLKCSSDLRLA